MSAKQAINDKLQGSVATCLSCGDIFNNQTKKGLLLGLTVKKNFFRSVNIWQSYKQERDCLEHFARLANTPLNTKKVHETITFMGVTFPNIHRFKKIHSQTQR